MEDTIRLNNRVLRERPAGMYVAFHAPTDMLVQLHGADAYFLNYDCGACDRNRLLWFIHEKEAVFGFVLSHYPQEDELDELQAKTESVLNYIPLKRFTLCLPDANALLSPSEADEEKQWETVRLGMEMAARIFSWKRRIPSFRMPHFSKENATFHRGKCHWLGLVKCGISIDEVWHSFLVSGVSGFIIWQLRLSFPEARHRAVRVQG